MVEVPACSPDGPRNVVLLSDGTGNSSAMAWRTNVWRMYEALEVSSGAQLALYDNGVGTSSFKPFAVLGGAFGWGLKRNVLDLYVFACRNYRPSRDGRPADRIYAMGFSRGAFTIRVLVDLIGHQGLITGASGRELDRQARWAYRKYREQFESRLGIIKWFRWMRDKALRLWEWRHEPYDRAKRDRNVAVTFMGLWDTVDAYGLPMDEMTRGWDQWVWPLKMDSATPPAHVTKICHAIALDDERHTFHPVMFDESNLPESAHIRDERVTQVWFSGVHSNVGGGYPDDSLAHVSLRWMAEQACKAGLRLSDVYTRVWEARADPHGPLYDSRRGLSNYYRYNPRNMARLAKNKFDNVNIPRPKIHCSVFQRIAAGRDEYAPIVLPPRYAVVDEDGAIVEADARFGEDAARAARRALGQERVWDRVWIRRVLYFTTVITTVLVVLPPLVMAEDSPGILPFPWSSRGLEGFIDTLSAFVPSMAEPVVQYYRNKPFQLVIPGGLIIVLMFASWRVQRSASDRMREIWTGGATKAGPHSFIYRLRTSAPYRLTFEALTQYVFPFIFGVGALLAVVLAVSGTVNRAGFALASFAGEVCDAPNEVPLPDPVTTKVHVTFANSEPCYFSGHVLGENIMYRATIEIPHGGWKDNRHTVPGPEGFSTGDNFFVAPFLPFRRLLTARWFVPVIRVGEHHAEYHLLNTSAEQGVTFSPRVTGPLFLFVNDAIGPGPWWKYFYENNDGGLATVTIARIDAPAAASTAAR